LPSLDPSEFNNPLIVFSFHFFEPRAYTSSSRSSIESEHSVAFYSVIWDIDMIRRHKMAVRVIEHLRGLIWGALNAHWCAPVCAGCHHGSEGKWVELDCMRIPARLLGWTGLQIWSKVNATCIEMQGNYVE
jgi:hypothetical protein